MSQPRIAGRVHVIPQSVLARSHQLTPVLPSSSSRVFTVNWVCLPAHDGDQSGSFNFIIDVTGFYSPVTTSIDFPNMGN